MISIRIILLSVFSIAFCSSAFAQFGPAVVVTADVEMRELAPSVEVPGTVISRFDSRPALNR